MLLTDALRRSNTSLLKQGLDAASAVFRKRQFSGWKPNRRWSKYGYISSNKRETVLPRIPDQEFSERVSKVQTKMRAQQIDLLVAYSNAFDPGHVRYFSDVVGINEAASDRNPIARRRNRLRRPGQGSGLGPRTNLGLPMSALSRR